MINKEKFAELFKKKRGKKTLEQIQKSLWDISLSCAKINNAEDYASYIWIELNNAIEKVKPDNPNIFSYFYTIAIRELSRIKQKDERIKPADVNHSRHIKAFPEPITKPNTLKLKGKHRDTIAKLIKRYEERLNFIDPELEEYGYGAGGLDALQELHFVLFGKYVLAEIPTALWLSKAKKSKAI